MVNTRRNNGEGSQHGAENNPPPPPQTLAEVVAQQTQILQMLVQNQVQQQSQPHGRQGQQQLATYNDFAGTHPPIFSKAEDPFRYSPVEGSCRLMVGNIPSYTACWIPSPLDGVQGRFQGSPCSIESD